MARSLAEILSHTGDPVLPGGSIGARRPSTVGEMPAIALSLDVEQSDELGFGRLVRSWDDVPGEDTVREETRGDRYRGMISLEIWASSYAQTSTIWQKVEARLAQDRPLLREKGFIVMQPASVDAAESVTQPSSTAPPFAAWKQRLAYRFVFESEEGGELGEADRIARIDVDVAETPESFTVP